MIFLSSSLQAATIRVPDDQPTIQAGIYAAVNGDTVLVAPGRYLVNLDFNGKDIYLTSHAGAEQTILEPDSIYLPIVTFGTGETDQAVLDGFTIAKTRGNAALRIDHSSPIIKNNIFTDIAGGRYGNNSAIYFVDSSQSLIKNNVFWKNDSAYCIIWISSSNSVGVFNNTIHSGRLGLYIYGQSATVKNNIITACQMGVSANATSNRGFNDVWGNGTDWLAGTPAPSDISEDPDFAAASSGNFFLLRSSPCIDAGEDSAQYNDPDGTRNDMGAIAFDQRCPSVNDMNLGYQDISHVTDDAPSFHWLYYDSVYMDQNGYQIQVGTDNDWSTAENWDSGPVVSSDGFVVYGGLPLIEGQTYFWRIRVSNGITESLWKEAAFRMNSPPSVPQPQFPISLEQVSVFGVYLAVLNSSDDENDLPVYDFETYSDPGLADLVAGSYNVPQGEAVTSSGLFKGLQAGYQYFWRARAYDGWEYSDWCASESFIVRLPVAIHVPGDQSNIQAGIDAAQEGDTVLVAPGTYAGDGNRDLDFHGTNLVLRSDGTGLVTIDCEGTPAEPHRALYLHNDEDSTSIIDGFFITGAYGSGLWDAAILLWSGATIRNCMIMDNQSRGITATATAPNYFRHRIFIENCFIHNNYSGITAIANGIISHCSITNNDSAGIYLFDMDSISVEYCLLFENQQYGIQTLTGSWGHYSITNNTIVQNGTGFYFYYDFPKDTLTDRYPQDLSLISANLIAYNLDKGFYGDGMGYVGVTVECNNSFGNPGGDYDPSWPYWPYAGDSMGNISANPLFCDFDTAYSISGASPCAPANNSCGVLMGAYGIGCSIICGDANSNGVINLLDIVFLINYIYKGGAAPLSLEACDVNRSGDIDILDITYLINYIYKSGPAPNCP
jgi:parallel beta-helix repeat protein